MNLIRDCDFDNLISERSQKHKGPMLYNEPFDRLDITLAKKLTILGGFSGSYKTTLAYNILYNNAIDLGYNGCFLSLEMEPNEIFLRILVRHAQHSRFRKYNISIKLLDVIKNNLTESEKDFLLNTVADDLKYHNHGQILVAGPDDVSGCFNGFGSFISKMEQMLLDSHSPQSTYGLHILVIDYIQLLAKFSRSQFKGVSDPFQIVGLIVRHLRHITHSYDNDRGISIIALSQLNRASYSSIKERLRKSKFDNNEKYKDLYDLTSIAESSEIVNAADFVLAIYTDDKLKSGKRAVIQLLKNRFGETLEEGIEVLALPEIAFIGDFNHEEAGCMSKEEEMAIFMHGLLNGTI